MVMILCRALLSLHFWLIPDSLRSQQELCLRWGSHRQHSLTKSKQAVPVAYLPHMARFPLYIVIALIKHRAFALFFCNKV